MGTHSSPWMGVALALGVDTPRRHAASSLLDKPCIFGAILSDTLRGSRGRSVSVVSAREVWSKGRVFDGAWARVHVMPELEPLSPFCRLHRHRLRQLSGAIGAICSMHMLTDAGVSIWRDARVTIK